MGKGAKLRLLRIKFGVALQQFAVRTCGCIEIICSTFSFYRLVSDVRQRSPHAGIGREAPLGSGARF
jgi:hypothetical protein